MEGDGTSVARQNRGTRTLIERGRDETGSWQLSELRYVLRDPPKAGAELSINVATSEVDVVVLGPPVHHCSNRSIDGSATKCGGD